MRSDDEQVNETESLRERVAELEAELAKEAELRALVQGV